MVRAHSAPQSNVIKDYGWIKINRVQSEEMPPEIGNTPDAKSGNFTQLHYCKWMINSVGSECVPYKYEVGGPNPSSSTTKI